MSAKRQGREKRKKQARKLSKDIRKDMFSPPEDVLWGGPAKPDKMMMEEASLMTCPECGRVSGHGMWCPKR